MTRKIATVTTAFDARTDRSVLYAGTYRVEMPEDYDAERITGEDILRDDAIRVVAEGRPLDREPAR